MERLVKENINTGSEYDKIYLERSKRQVDSQDMRRWKILLKYYKGGKLLDIGSLDSKIVDLVANPTDYFGIDVAGEAIRDMQDRNGGTFLVRNLYNLDKDWFNRFDYAIMGEVVEHLEEPEKAIKEAMRVLKVGGILALSTPLEEAREPGAVDRDRHLWSFSVKDIIDMLKPYGSVKVNILGSEYFPKYKYRWKTILAYCKKK